MANLGRESTNNNGVQDAQLRAVKPAVDTTALKSDLAAGKEKALADDIIAKLSEKLNLSQEALGEYLQKLTSKSIDATLARVVNVVKRQGNAEFSESQIEGIRELLAEAAAAKEQPQAPKALTLAQLQEFFASQKEEKQDPKQNEQKDEALSLAQLKEELDKRESAQKQSEKPSVQSSDKKTVDVVDAAEAAESTDSAESEQLTDAAVVQPEDLAAAQAFIQGQFDKLFDAESQILEATTTALDVAQAASESPIAKLDTKLTDIVTEVKEMSENSAVSQIEQLAIPAAENPDTNAQEIVEKQTSALESAMHAQAVQLSTMLTDSTVFLQAALLSPLQQVKAAIDVTAEAVGQIVLGPIKAIGSQITKLGTSVVEAVGGMLSSIKGTVFGIASSVTSAISAPFKAIGEKISTVGTALKDGFARVMTGIGSALTTVALAPLKAIGSMFSALNPFKRKKKKKKSALELKLGQMIDKVNDFIDNFFDRMLGHVDAFLDRVLKSAKKIVSKLMLHVFTWILVNVGMLAAIFAILLPMIADPLMKILQPIMDFIDGIVGKIKEVIIAALEFLKPVRDFLLNVLSKAWAIIEVPLQAFFKGIAAGAEALGKGLVLFVNSVLNVLKLLMDGIAEGAFGLGKALVTFATAVVDVLVLFMKGLSTQAEAIGIGLGKFVTSCLNVLTLLMDGIGTQAKAIGEALGKLVLALVDVATYIVDFAKNVVGLLTDIVNIIRKPIQFVADFFEGLGTKAKAIGEKMGDIILKVLTKIEWAIDNLTSLVRMYVIAPLMGIRRKMLSLMVKLAEKFEIPVPIMDFHGSVKPWKWEIKIDKVHPFGFLTGGMDKVTIDQARADEDKPVSELISDEMGKMEAKINAENAAAEADKLAKSLQQKKMQQMLDSIHVIDDIWKVVSGSVLSKLDNIIDNLHALFEAMDLVYEDMQEEVEADAGVIVPSVSSENVVALQSASSNETADQVEAVSQEATANAAVTATADKKKDKALMQFLSKMSAAMDNNFNAILEKLDSKPDLMPMPILTPTNANNLASMENLF